VLGGGGVAALARRAAGAAARGGDGRPRPDPGRGSPLGGADDRGGDGRARLDPRRGAPLGGGDDRGGDGRARPDPRSDSPLAWLLAAALVAGVLAFTAGDLSDQLGQLGERADRRTDLGALIDAAGGAGEINGCAPARTVQPMKAMLAWRLDLSMEHLADPPRAPASVFQVPPGYAGEPAEPPVPDFFAPPVAMAGDWTLFMVCELRPLAARTAP
jgi:hypothetical protein